MDHRDLLGRERDVNRKNVPEKESIKIIAVTNRKLCCENFLSRIEALAEAGVDALLLRETDMLLEEYGKLAMSVHEICRRYGTAFIPHRFYHVADKLQTEYLHLPGSNFISLINDKNSCYQGMQDSHRIGVSVHSLKEAQFAQKNGAAYLIAGHIFSTDCKTGLEPRGASFLKEICDTVSLPVYGIGGIDNDNAAGVLNAGARGVCLMSSLMTCSDPKALITEMRRL